MFRIYGCPSICCAAPQQSHQQSRLPTRKLTKSCNFVPRALRTSLDPRPGRECYGRTREKAMGRQEVGVNQWLWPPASAPTFAVSHQSNEGTRPPTCPHLPSLFLDCAKVEGSPRTSKGLRFIVAFQLSSKEAKKNKRSSFLRTKGFRNRNSDLGRLGEGQVY